MNAPHSRGLARPSATPAPRGQDQIPVGGHFRALTIFAESPDCVRGSRAMVDACLRDWGLTPLVDDVRLIVSELVGNVVHHVVPDDCLSRPGAARRIDVVLRMWSQWLFLGVTDEDSTLPDLPVGEFVSPELAGELSAAVLPDSGRGLFIVHRLVDYVWCEPGEVGGKTVWCRFDLDGGATDAVT
ncbi:ATP-binding protein [Streptomyces venezuelae]|uniref:ATP-binding protein n=1 Tax=Streptomyces venezuelae TaxID=54571 RepID=UPI0037AD3E68